MEKTKPNLPNRWLVFTVAVIGSICVAVSWMKVSGTMVFIKGEYGIDVTTAGMLMSITALANLLIALPGGSIVAKFGVRKVWLFGIVWCLAFNVLGFFAPDFTTLAITRFCEGISLGFVFIVAPVIITEAFPAEKRGLPMTLWSIWSTVGTLIVLNLCNFFTPQFGWRSNWLVAAAFLAVAFVLNFLFCRVQSDRDKSAKNAEVKRDHAPQQKKQGAWSECLKNPACVCICIVFFAAIFAFNVYTSYYPTFLQSTMGLPSAEANSVSTVHTYWMIFLCLTFGFALNKIKNMHHPKIFLVLTFFVVAGGTLMWNMPSIPLDIVAILLCGTGMQLIGPMAHNLVPDTVAPHAVPVGMGMLSFASGLGSMLGPVICGQVVDATGNWGLMAVPVGIVSLIGIAAAIVVLRKMYKGGTTQLTEGAPAIKEEGVTA
ncbi:hypothetical protein C1878_11995 [Gordonibacter sp. 28C]|uniref:MFS transporter n=1 Tax=Gordonibacter sp. 28C TaxID=2078569 RepID=UPI000DF80D57|nr:MFS transporter [Gordonibacter sp. 28C]RDB61209.1 hypothetical protein C1878_11995 [Gordonibacter sp. 28C]